MYEIIVDTREQLEWSFKGVPTIKKKLDVGDYSLQFLGKDYSDEIVIERKTLADFVACCGVERNRFMRELERSRNIPLFYVIIEGSWEDIYNQNYRSLINPNSVLSTIISFGIRYGARFILAGNRLRAKDIARRIFEMFMRFKSGKNKIPIKRLTNKKKKKEKVELI